MPREPTETDGTFALRNRRKLTAMLAPAKMTSRLDNEIFWNENPHG